MADEKKTNTEAEVTEEVNAEAVDTEVVDKKDVKAEKASKADKKAKEKTPSKFSPKKIGKSIAEYFKNLRGETKKIVWPSRHMVIKSTGVVLAAIIVIGAGIWIVDYALAGAIGAVDGAAASYSEKAAEAETATDTTAADTTAADTTKAADTTAADTTEATTEASTVAAE